MPTGYGYSEYGIDHYGDPVTVTGTGGGITVWFELWRATINNALVEDISDYLTGGEASFNVDRAIKHEARFDLRDALSFLAAHSEPNPG